MMIFGIKRFQNNFKKVMIKFCLNSKCIKKDLLRKIKDTFKYAKIKSDITKFIYFCFKNCF